MSANPRHQIRCMHTTAANHLREHCIINGVTGKPWSRRPSKGDGATQHAIVVYET